MSRRVRCHICGMTYRVGYYACGRCMMRARPDPECECHGTGETATAIPPHECPPPLPYEVAAAMAASSIIVSPTMAARIRRGLKAKPA